MVALVIMFATLMVVMVVLVVMFLMVVVVNRVVMVVSTGHDRTIITFNLDFPDKL